MHLMCMMKTYFISNNMFIEFITKRKEKICLNICEILYVTEVKGKTVIVDTIGTDYEIDDSYEHVMKRLYNHLDCSIYLSSTEESSTN